MKISGTGKCFETIVRSESNIVKKKNPATRVKESGSSHKCLRSSDVLRR